MSDEDNLIRYHFGDMSEDEAAQFEQRLEEMPSLSKRLDKLRNCMGCEEEPNIAPSGLADRTCDSVADLRLEDLQPRSSGSTDGLAARTCQFSLLDASVAIFAIGLIALIVAPSILASRETSRRLTCEMNLRDIGQALILYADDHGKTFPHLNLNEHAGMFTVMLAEGGYLERDAFEELVVCPASELANCVSKKDVDIWIPTRLEYQETSDLLREKAKLFMSGSYAYRLGYFKKDKYLPNGNSCDLRSALLSDAPTCRCPDRASPNHGCEGQNILFQNGRVKFQKSCRAPCKKDHIFLNNNGQAAAGTCWNDTVLARSETCPKPQEGTWSFDPFANDACPSKACKTDPCQDDNCTEDACD